MPADHPPQRRDIFVVVAAYALTAALWILFSDRVVELLVRDPAQIIRISIFKGWVFVAVTALMLYVLVRRLIHRVDQAYQRELAAYAERQRSLDLLSAIANHSDDAIFAKDLQGRYLFFNTAAGRFVGKVASEVIGKDDRALFPSEQAEALIAIGRRVIAEGQIEVNEETLETTLGTRVFLATKGPMRDADGRIFGLFGVSRDITERKADEIKLAHHREHLEDLVDERTRQLMDAKAEAEAASGAKSAFLANMSHEIRTPLNAITGLAYLIRRSGLEPAQLDHIGKLEAASEHLLGVIDAILDLSKIEAGKFVLVNGPLRVGELLTNVADIVRERVAAKGLELVIEEGAIPGWLLGDVTRLQQALLNYASNALKFTEQGRIVLRAAAMEETDDSVLVRFEVEDSGIGIPPDAMPRLFNAFEQADNSTTRQYGGTGLGLAITRKIAELMQGAAGAENREAGGSTFWFTVRLKKTQAPAGEAHSHDAAFAEQCIRRQYQGARILVAEDEPVNRELVEELLKEAGLRVDIAQNGIEACERARETDYALILMDMQMPFMDGLDATRRIRELPHCVATPIIAMTANAFAEDRERCLAAGMNDFIGKPARPDMFFNTLLRWLGRSSTLA